jgi:signal transduction histidine kinase
MNLWKWPGLSSRILMILLLLLAISFVIGLTAIWYAGEYNTLLNQVINKDMAAVTGARELQTELANQKGYVTYYFLDGDKKWLNELDVHRRAFENWLDKSYELNPGKEYAQLLNDIRQKYESYIRGKDQVIELYSIGDRETGERIHTEVRKEFFQLNDLCDRYKHLNEEKIKQILTDSQDRSRDITTIAGILMGLNLLLGAFLVFIVFQQILIPIRQLAGEADKANEPGKAGDDVGLLRKRVYGLLEDMDRARSELKQSKALLMNSEKMALVGKLATEVAHSIRNPMTSINMRLFSLKRNLELSDIQKEDFDVVADEMRRLDHIVRNFLEFSRPHKLKKQRVDISKIIDMTIDLLAYRLELHSVIVHRKRGRNLPFIDGDPELLKEVFVNLVVNACEAMENGGEVMISEEEAIAEIIGRAILVKVSDNGPGIPEDMAARVLQPFETTKPDGTGLGLFITVRIVEGHGGKLEFVSKQGEGTTFMITLPVSEEETL